MQPTAITIRNHRLLAVLLSQWETAHGAFGPDRYIRLQRLWTIVPPDSTTENLRQLLCPIFASNDNQQEQFNILVEKLKAELDTDGKPSQKTDFSNSTKPEKPAAPSKPFEDSPEPSASPSAPRQSEHRPLVVQLDECTDPPFTWNIIADDDKVAIDSGPGFQRTAVQLRRRELADHAMLDMPATVRTTMLQAGMPAVRYRQLTRPPEYLLLIERFSQNDHRAGLFDHFYQTLRANEVFVERFFYDGDLRICRNERYPAGLNLLELRYRFASARLLVLGSGYRLISSSTGQLAKWTTPLHAWMTRVLLTPMPPEQWGRKEILLGKIFTLLPASMASLQFVAESAGNDVNSFVQYALLPDYIRQLAESKPITLEEPLMRSLRRHFNSGMLCWIAACGIYPALHFDLTLRLGRLLSESLEQNLVTADNILNIACLPWFTTGKIPMEARDELVEYLEHRHPERHQLVLAFLLDLLEKNPPPENSVSWAEHQINLALLKIRTDAEPNEETIRQLIPVVKRLHRPERRGDFVLPEKWEEYIKKIGIAEDSSQLVVENQIIKGRVSAISGDDVVLDINYKSDGLIPLSEFRDTPDLSLGDEVEIYVESHEDSESQLGLSRRKAKILRAWESIVDSFKNGTIILGTVISKTKGGLIVDCNGLETFLPGSQIDIKPVIDYDQYIGKMMEFIVVKVNEQIKNAVVSHKALIERDLAEQREHILGSLEKGQVLEGMVKNITDFGAFLDLGGVDGLLYITDISWGRIGHPSEVLQLNQRINVVVLDFDENKKRISLGLKQLTPHPWEVLPADVTEGSIVKGKIVNIEDYGAFMEILPGVEGLIHVSEITWGNQSINAKEYFKMGQEVEARVVTIDRADRKMSLSTKDVISELDNFESLNKEEKKPLKISRAEVLAQVRAARAAKSSDKRKKGEYPQNVNKKDKPKLTRAEVLAKARAAREAQIIARRSSDELEQSIFVNSCEEILKKQRNKEAIDLGEYKSLFILFSNQLKYGPNELDSRTIKMFVSILTKILENTSKISKIEGNLFKDYYSILAQLRSSVVNLETDLFLERTVTDASKKLSELSLQMVNVIEGVINMK